MTVINDSAEIEIQCPQCDKKFKKTIKQLKGRDVMCPHCNVRFETSKFKKGLDQVEKSNQDFLKGFKNIKIKL